MPILINGATAVDPGSSLNGLKVDILIDNGKIVKISPHGSEGETVKNTTVKKSEPDRVIDASGLLAAPGLIDMHVHLREPGFEYKETIETGAKAAVCGGFTAVCAMPNTDPVNDHRQVTEFILSQAAKAKTARVFPVGAITRGSEGKALCEYGDLKAGGVIALSDDGNPVKDSQMMRRAMEYAKGFDLPIISHCEEVSLAAGGVMNEGETSTRMGLAGIPNAAESIMVMRDIALCELTGARLHIAHVSTKESVWAIRDAKKRGVPVTAETAPHYFTLTDKAVKDYNTHAKMNPPLRTEADRQAIIEGLSDGTIDAIATDHAPHSIIEKDVEFDRAANGIIGLETSLSLSLELVRKDILTISELIRKMSINPAKILGFKRALEPGGIADVTLFDTKARFTVNAEEFNSKSRNTPFDGWNLQGKAVMTIVGGSVVFEQL